MIMRTLPCFTTIAGAPTASAPAERKYPCGVVVAKRDTYVVTYYEYSWMFFFGSK